MAGWHGYGDLFDRMFPVAAGYPPTRWERFKAWCKGEQAHSTVIRRVW